MRVVQFSDTTKKKQVVNWLLGIFSYQEKTDTEHVMFLNGDLL